MKSNAKYKQTEIGEIPEDWKILSLGDVAFFQNGKSSPSRNIDGKYPVYGSNGRIGFANKSNSEPGSIVIGRVGSYCGSLFLTTQPSWITDNAIKATSKNENDPRFIFYLLHTLNLNSRSGGSGQPLLNQQILQSIPIAVPNLSEQQQIASILSSLDDKIELNRRMNKTLEEMGKVLFKRWFVHFEFPNENGEPYKSSGGEMVESELGVIPKGWKVTKIDEVCNTFGGGTPSTKKTEYWKDGNILWATPTDITALKSPIIFDTSRKITKEGLSNSSAKLLSAGTILLTSRATVGLLAISDKPITTNQGFIAIECKGMPSNFYMYFNLFNRQHEIISKATGSTFREISRSTFRSMSLLLPTEELHDKFNSVVGSLFEQIRVNSLENQYLSNMRDSVLPRLMNGSIRVNT